MANLWMRLSHARQPLSGSFFMAGVGILLMGKHLQRQFKYSRYGGPSPIIIFYQL